MVLRLLQHVKNLQNYMGTSKASKIAQRMTRDATILGIAEPLTRSGSEPNEDYGFIVQPESTKGLKGKDLALATIKNKFRYAKEGTLIGGGFPLVAKIAQQLYKYVAKPVVKGTLNLGGKTMGGVAKVASMDKYILPTMAKGLRYAAVKPLEKVVAPIIIGAWSRTNPIKVAKQLPPFSEWRMLTKTNPNKVTSEIKSLDDFLSNFRSFADDTIEMGLIKEELKNTIKGKSRRINKALDDLDEAYYELAQGFQGKYNKGITSRVGKI